MKNFFEQMEPWDHNDGALHLYVLPGEEEIERLAAARELIDGIDGLPLMPEPYLHLTLQKLAHFDDQLTQPKLSRLGAAIERALAGISSFDLELGTPVVVDTGVTCGAPGSAEWDALVAAVRSGITEALGVSPALPAPPYGPHLTLSYATADVDDALITERLAGAAPVGTLRVDEVHLVSVTVRPEIGIFDFTHLASWDLA